MAVVHKIGYGVCRWFWQIARPITVGVRAILSRGGQIVLVRHTYQKAWYLPGGGVKRGETLSEAIAREAAEEVGASLGEIRLLGVYSNFVEGKSDHVAIFVCSDFTLTGATDGEIRDFGLFGPDDLPPGTSLGTRRRVQEYVQGAGPYVERW